MSTTAQSVINASILLLNSFDPGETPNASESADALLPLQNLVDNWSQQRLMIPAALTTTTNLVSGQQAYTIGTGGNINITRPARIEGASFKISNIVFPLKILTVTEWNNILDRDATGNAVKGLFYDRRNAAGLGNVYFTPVPLGGAVIMQTWHALTNFADLTTGIDLEPGYLRALTAALAIEIAPQYGATVTPELLNSYSEAMSALRSLNASLMSGEPPQGYVSSQPNQAGAIAEQPAA